MKTKLQEEILDEDKKEKIMDNVNIYFDKKGLSNIQREDITFDLFCEFRDHNRSDETIEEDEDEGIEEIEDEVDDVDDELDAEKTDEEDAKNTLPEPPKPAESKIKRLFASKKDK